VSRTSGLPFGPGGGQPEAVGRADVVASALELATALALVPLLRYGGVLRQRLGGVVAAPAAAAGVVALVAGVTAFAVARPAAVVHGHGHGHGGPLAAGEYPLGEPLHTPLESRGPGFYFAAWPLLRVVLELGVGPTTTGVNTFDVVVVDHVGKRVEVPDVRVTARLDGSGVRPLRFRAARLSPGHFVVDVARLSKPGNWRMRVEGRRTARGSPLFEHTFTVPVGEAGSARRG
jgi:hypothetical protein